MDEKKMASLAWTDVADLSHRVMGLRSYYGLQGEKGSAVAKRVSNEMDQVIGKLDKLCRYLDQEAE